MTHDFSPETESNGNALQNISEPIQPRDYWKKIFAPQSEEDRNRSLDTLDVPVDGVDGVDGVFKEKPAPKSFPVEAMPKESRELIREAAAAIGCPPEFVAVPMLAALSSAIGNSRVIELKRGWIEGAAIYAAIVADPGEKKTPAAKVALDPAVRKQASLRQDYREELEKYEQDMREYEVQRKDARQEGRAADAPPQPPSMKRTLVEDTTVEALAVVLQGTPRGVLAVRDELAA
jgi:hypothetical protein